MSMTADEGNKAFSLRMALSQAGIPWRACYAHGDDFVRFATVSEAGIKMLIGDYPDATETGIFVAGRLVLVAGLEAAKAVLAQPEPVGGQPDPEATGHVPLQGQCTAERKAEERASNQRRREKRGDVQKAFLRPPNGYRPTALRDLSLGWRLG
jgi:hypothetical protein